MCLNGRILRFTLRLVTCGFHLVLEDRFFHFGDMSRRFVDACVEVGNCLFIAADTLRTPLDCRLEIIDSGLRTFLLLLQVTKLIGDFGVLDAFFGDRTLTLCVLVFLILELLGQFLEFLGNAVSLDLDFMDLRGNGFALRRTVCALLDPVPRSPFRGVVRPPWLRV